jgi:hypothetical protein
VGLILASFGLFAQTAPKPRVIGEITGLDAAKKELTLKGDDGTSSTIQLNDATKFLRVPPGEKDLTKATAIAMGDLAAGDRALVLGGSPATRVIVMTKADIAKKHEADRAEWQKRGVAGTVTAVDTEKKEISISMRTAEGQKTVAIDASGQANFRRYSQDSVRFSEAKPSSLAELQKGDQLRALGEKNADGTQLKAEEVVFGTFRTIAGTINNVNADAGEITIKDLDTKKPVVVKVGHDTALKKIPNMLAEMLAMRLRGEVSARPGGAPGAAAARPSQGAPGGFGGAGGPGGPGGRRGNMDFQDMLERMPAFTLADLKNGDAIVLSSTLSADPAKVTAITVVAGVEPLLTAAPARQIGGALNFDIGMPTM